MHAIIEQLLLIKEGEKSTFDQHFKNCEICQNTLQELNQVQTEMQNLSSQAPANMWGKIQSEYESKQYVNHSARLIRAIYTLAATILITGSLIVFSNYQQAQSNQELYQDINQLMANSSALENVISMQINSGQIAVDNGYQNEKLKWRLMLIDQQLQSTQTGDIHNRIILWQDRIRALKALKQNMYANNTQQL